MDTSFLGAFMNEPHLDMLEAHHSFPGIYVFKAIGKADPGFVARVVAAVRDGLAAEVDPPYTVRSSSGGKHIAVTLEASVRTAQEVLDVYSRVQHVAGLEVLW